MSNSLVGIGLRSCHIEQFIREKPDIGWIEIHSENYSSLGGLDFDHLNEIREYYPISMHGIGMSLGSADGIDRKHIKSIKDLIKIIDPFLVSDHLSWSATSDKYLPDLLPTPFNQESLDIFTENIMQVQEILDRQILIENPSTYFEYDESTMPEYEFLNELTERTGAKIILDLNNVYISGLNNGWSPSKYLDQLNFNVGEIHLSGHMTKTLSNGKKLYIDSHNDRVSLPVWDLYQLALKKFGNIPALIEWDVNIPELTTLLSEAKKVVKYLDKHLEKQYA